MSAATPLSDHSTTAQTPIRVAVYGAAGRMGEGILAACAMNEGFEVVAALVRQNHPRLGEHVVAHAPALSADLQKALGGADVLVDFSSPGGMLVALEAAEAAGVPFVTGTTGLALEHHARLQKAAATIPVIAAPNMSLGVNLLQGLVARATRALEDWDVEIFELHHKFKRDAPSGTALGLARAAAAAVTPERALQRVREGGEALRQQNEVGLAALRGGDVVGEHTVFLLGEGERIELTHRATNRMIFVYGALRAVKWVVGQEVGLYSMQDVLFGVE